MQLANQGHESSNRHQSFAGLLIGAIGVVYGDIGTSPLYALKECFLSAHAPPLTHDNILGVLSLIFWSVMLIVSLKYVIFIMRADNDGEGGILALLALTQHLLGRMSTTSHWIILAGAFGAALFYADGIITPAISVLSAVEGLIIVSPQFASYVLPIATIVLILMFLMQRFGTEKIGILFGPIMYIWFMLLAGLGLLNIFLSPSVLAAMNPYYAYAFFQEDGWHAFLTLGGVVLATTGAEALYADMGHFGREPIRWAWFGLVAPALLLNYFGQGALLISSPQAVENPFYLLAPSWATIPLLVFATMATIIASQAVISGAFSLTRQAIQLGFLPRMRIQHTSAAEMGQVYVPFINWALLFGVIVVVYTFKTSSGLAAAYGIAVTGTMVITTLLAGVVMIKLWRWPVYLCALILTLFLVVDLAFLSANLTKFISGGWLPVLVGIILLVLLMTWKEGRQLVANRMRELTHSRESLLRERIQHAHRVQGTAVFLTSNVESFPNAFWHNLEHNKVIHERVVFVTVEVEDHPHVGIDERVKVSKIFDDIYWIIIHYGFMEDPDIPAALALCHKQDLVISLNETSFFLSREIAIPTVRPGMAMWREHLFTWMGRNANSAMEFFNLPKNRVVDMGCHLEI